MATRAFLTPEAASFPSTNFATPLTIHSTDRIPVLAFDASTAETAFWSMVAPQGISGTWYLYVLYVMASATSGGVAFDASIQAVTPADALDLDAATGYDTANTGTDTVQGTAGYLDVVAITLTNMDSVAAGDWMRIKLTRAVANASDTASGDCYVLGCEVRDSA